MKIMEIKDIIEICYQRFPGTVIVDAWESEGYSTILRGN